jgi:phospholipid transport system transporter-binding protein
MKPDLHIQLQGHCLALSGELDHGGVCRALKAGRDWISSGDGLLQVDLGGITRCESAGVALLLEWLRQARRQDRQIEFLRIPEQMRVLVKFFDLERVLPLRA